MKWATLTRGKRARKRDIEFTPLDSDTPIRADFRLLDGADFTAVLRYATDYAKAAGATSAEGEGVYEFGKCVMTVVLALTDPDSPDDKPEQFFAHPAECFEALDADRIIALAKQQRFFQDTVSPFQFEMSNAVFTKHVVDLATSEEGDDHPFVTWLPAMQLSFSRSMAKRLAASLLLNSPISSSGDTAIS